MQKLNLWLAYAQNDLKAAQVPLVSGDVSIASVLYCAQQSAEKALKAYLFAQNVPIPRTHDLIKLVDACSLFDSEFETIRIRAGALNPLSTTTRYPEHFLSMLHTIVADQAIGYARQILEFSEMKIASSAPSYKMPKKQILKQI